MSCSTNAVALAEIVRRGLHIADMGVVTDIECNALPVQLIPAGVLWWDLRPMLDPNEVCNEFLDMNTECIAYAEQRGLIVRHPQQPHLVRITTRGQA